MERKNFYELFREMNDYEFGLFLRTLCNEMYGEEWNTTVYTILKDFCQLPDETVRMIIAKSCPNFHDIDIMERGTAIFERLTTNPYFTEFITKFLIRRYGHDRGKSKEHITIIKDFMTASNDYLEETALSNRLSIYKAMGDEEINKSLIKIERLSNGVGYRTR